MKNVDVIFSIEHVICSCCLVVLADVKANIIKKQICYVLFVQWCLLLRCIWFRWILVSSSPPAIKTQACLKRIMQGALEKVLGIASAHNHEDWYCFKLSGSLSIARPPMLWDGQALCKRFKSSKCAEVLNITTLQQISTTNLTAKGGRHSGLPGRVGSLLHHWTNPCHRWGQEHYVS